MAFPAAPSLNPMDILISLSNLLGSIKFIPSTHTPPSLSRRRWRAGRSFADKLLWFQIPFNKLVQVLARDCYFLVYGPSHRLLVKCYGIILCVHGQREIVATNVVALDSHNVIPSGIFGRAFGFHLLVKKWVATVPRDLGRHFPSLSSLFQEVFFVPTSLEAVQ